MKTERRFTWCVRYYNVTSGDVEYRMYFGWTVREINEFVADFIASNENYVVRVFKNYKAF